MFTAILLIVPVTATAAGADGNDALAIPDLEYFATPGIAVDGWEAPAISNHWLWAQAAFCNGRGILNMEDVRCGGEPQFHGTVVVLANGHEIRLGRLVADWWPNKVRREAVIDGVRYTGTVAAAREKYALLGRLAMTNASKRPLTVRLELRFARNGGHHGTVEHPAERTDNGSAITCRFEPFVLEPGKSRVVRAVNLYRADSKTLNRMLSSFDEEWEASDAYWNELLADAYTPGPGKYLSGSMPRFRTTEKDAQRFYHFGIVTALMLLKRDPDRFCKANLYVTAMPDAGYGTSCYMWDVGYASNVLAMLDPEALRTTVEHWAALGPHSMLSFRYDTGERLAPGRFYASNGSMFFLAAWNYLTFSGDYGWLDKEVAGKTMLRHLRDAADWHKTRPQWNGLAHYGEEKNLFDDHTVVGYHHFVAAPNAACVWMKRRLADVYEKVRQDQATARQLRKEAKQLAEALVRHLYNDEGDYLGTWKQRHQDGRMLRIRHSWDFMNSGSFLAEDLSPEQRKQMRDWFVGNLVRFGSDDVWVVAQDPRDGNNGPHQMEHNGRGAYPAWPYHDGWALRELGFHQDVVDLLRVIDGITRHGAIGQGYYPGGRRCRSNWVNAAGATAAAYLTRHLFDVAPDPEGFHPQPRLGDFDPNAFLEDVPVRGRLYRVTAGGAMATGRMAR